MAMMQQPRTPSPPSSSSVKSWLTTEWDHLDTMPLATMGLLFVPSLLLCLVNPLLPVAAYILQHWARASWTWRDRWARIPIWATQGTVMVILLVLLACLASAHIVFVSALVAGLQTAWLTAHLPGTLSLSLLDGHALVARSLLSLPLAPALSLYYERIDPRTSMHLQRVLTPADLAALTQPPPVAPPASPHTATQEQTTTPPKPKRRKTSSTKKQHPPTPATPTEQRTIDSVLVPDQAQKPTPSASPQGTRDRVRTTHTSTGTLTTHTTDQKPSDDPDDIDWDDVAE